MTTSLFARQPSTFCMLMLAIISATSSSLSGDTGSNPWSELGKKAEEQYSGEGLQVTRLTSGEALLRCAFQKLDAHATTRGLWLTSTTEATKTEKFRVMAVALGRTSLPLAPLAQEGSVVTKDSKASLIRPGVSEEYSVSMDGVRQDFLILQRPAGEGAVCLELDLDGAVAKCCNDAIEITLPSSQRQINYCRLHVTDARGRTLPARMELQESQKLRIIVEDSAAAYPMRIDPTFSDADWVSMGSDYGVSGHVDAMAVAGTDLYVAGWIQSVGWRPAGHIAKWNGDTWSTLGRGVSNTNDNSPNIRAIAVSGSNVYVGGSFQMAGSVSASNIAKWDGTAWSSLADGVDGPVHALAIVGDDLYAGGSFSRAIGFPNTMYVARWNGSAWSSVGLGGPTGIVSALASSEERLYVGGSFSDASNKRNNIAVWDGSNWLPVGNGISYSVSALAVSGQDVYAGGDFNGVAKSTAGGEWTFLGSGFDGKVHALSAVGNIVYAGGRFKNIGVDSVYLVAKWDGSTWTNLGNQPGQFETSRTVDAIAVIGDTIYAGGSFGDKPLDPFCLAKCENGTWSSFYNGVKTTINAMVANDTGLYIGGTFTAVAGNPINKIARWDGSSWHSLGTGVNGNVHALAILGSDLYAGGAFTEAGSSAANRVAKWNGTSWSALGEGMNDDVYALVASGAQLVAAGKFTQAGPTAASRIAKWNGSTWSALGSGLDNVVNALSVEGAMIYAGGDFNNAGSVAAKKIAKWNGASWSNLGTGLNGPVYVVESVGTSVYAGGLFSLAGDQPANNIAMWNGTTWNALGNGLDAQVESLQWIEPDLYVGGRFNYAGPLLVEHIAKWDGTNWNALGSGMRGLWVSDSQDEASPPRVKALALLGTSLFVGGSFYQAGGKITSAIAKLTNVPVAKVPDISVEDNLGVQIMDDSVVILDSTNVGTSTNTTFLVKNLGLASLDDVSVTKGGANASMFTVTKQPSASVPPGGSSSFTISFTPASVGLKTATLHIDSNDPDENAFGITLHATGTAPPPVVPPVVKTLAASALSHDSAVLNGTVNARDSERSVFFDYGTTTAYGSTVSGAPSSVSSSTDTPVIATITGLQPHTKYHFRARAVGTLGAASGTGMTFTTLNRAPTAAADTFAVLPGATILLPVTANDTDADGDVLSVSSSSALSPAKAGKLARAGNVLAFTAETGFAGATFNYSVKDAFGAISETTPVSLILGTCTILPTQTKHGPMPLSFAINVAAEGAWSVVESLSWASVMPTSGNGNGVVQVTIQANTGLGQRSGSLFIGGEEHRIVQEGVSTPALSQPDFIPPAAVGAPFSMTIPTQNLPVLYSLTNLPPGLRMDGNTGLLSGKPTKGGSYDMVVKAKNAAGSAETALSFKLVVASLHDSLIGSYQGLVAGHEDLNDHMGSRLEVTTTSTGSLSGKIITGTTAFTFKGVMEVDIEDQDHPTALINVSRGKIPPLLLSLVFDRASQTHAGQAKDGPLKSAVINGWRNPWSAKNKVPAYYRKLHTFVLEQQASGDEHPQGYGFGSFPIVAESTGAVVLGGRLADGSPFSSSCFLGHNGELLLYAPLYANRGSLAGRLTVTPHDAAEPDNSVNGTPVWFKPSPLPNSSDTTYKQGFGPQPLTANGAAYPGMAPGGLLLGLTSAAPSAVLEFAEGGLDTETREFHQNLTLANPSATGKTQQATLSAPVANNIKLSTLNPANGYFSGEFTLAGASATGSRKAVYQGQIVKRGSLIQGYGHFLLPETSAAKAAKKSGTVLFRASAP